MDTKVKRILYDSHVELATVDKVLKFTSFVSRAGGRTIYTKTYIRKFKGIEFYFY